MEKRRGRPPGSKKQEVKLENLKPILDNVKDIQILLANGDKYREGQDYLSEFANEKIIKKTDSKVTKTELIEEFKNWYSNQYGRASLPKAREITDYMDKRYGKPLSCKWHNVAIVYDNQEDAKMDD